MPLDQAPPQKIPIYTHAQIKQEEPFINDRRKVHAKWKRRHHQNQRMNLGVLLGAICLNETVTVLVKVGKEAAPYKSWLRSRTTMSVSADWRRPNPLVQV